MAAAAAALAETIPIRLDDNVTVPFTAAGVLWRHSLITADQRQLWLPILLQRLPVGAPPMPLWPMAAFVPVRSPFSGAVCRRAIGIVIVRPHGWAGWALLMATFLAAASTSRLGLRRKTLLGIAEDRGGRRGAGNALANTGVAAVAAVLAARRRGRSWRRLRSWQH